MTTATTLQIHPLSQSRQGDLACEALYHARHIDGMKSESEASRRGTEIHAIVRKYVDHLVRTKQQTDYGYFDELASDAGEDAAEVLEKFRENYFVDPDQVVATEWRIRLDENFSPAVHAVRNVLVTDDHHVVRGIRAVSAGGEPDAAYEGTLDLVLMAGPTTAVIHDWKSHYMIFNADTFQSKLYPLFLFCVNPAIEEVKFILEFARYGASREVTWKRSDVPKLQELARRERDRQLKQYQLDREPGATPGKHCAWCPILLDGCPVSTRNPYAKMSPEQRLQTTMYLEKAYEASKEVLKAFVLEQGEIRAQDDNGAVYHARFEEKKKKSYPLYSAYVFLLSWFEDNRKDGDYLMKTATIGGLSSALKAQKRAQLAKNMEQIADITVTTEFKVGEEK